MQIIVVLVAALITTSLLLTQASSTTVATVTRKEDNAQDPTTLQDVKHTDHEVHDRLEQLHMVINSLQSKVQHMNKGHDHQMRSNTERMQRRFSRLSSVISKLSAHNTKLYSENKALRHSNGALVDKITALEGRLKRMAEREANAGAEVWLRQTAVDLKRLLEESGLEHFSSPRFSPLVAGLVSNGVVMVPLSTTSVFLLHYVKQLTVMHIVMALNLFELGMAVAVAASSMLLLGDPLEGLRHISEANFVFLQIVVAGVFWALVALLVVAVAQLHRRRGWKFLMVELALKAVVGIEYGRRVWVPVMDGDDVAISLPAWYYAAYVALTMASIGLTVCANRCGVCAGRFTEAGRLGPADEHSSDDIVVAMMSSGLGMKHAD